MLAPSQPTAHEEGREAMLRGPVSLIRVSSAQS